jgi:hypothetical protein
MSAFTGRVCFAAVRSVFSDKKKLFIAALSQTLPEGLSEPTRPGRAARARFVLIIYSRGQPPQHSLTAGPISASLRNLAGALAITAQ